jgi:hypothetical protein
MFKMRQKKAKLRSALLNNLINGILEVITKHRCSLSRNEVVFLEQSIILLKEYKKLGKNADNDFKLITIQVIEILIRFFLFSSRLVNTNNI